MPHFTNKHYVTALKTALFLCLRSIRDQSLFAFPPEGGGEVTLLKGDKVLVVGAATRRGHLLVQHPSGTIAVPYQYMELKPLPAPT